MADQVVATSTSRWRVPPDDVVVIEPPRPSGAAQSRAMARSALAEEGVPDDGLWLGMAGRLVAYKGIDTAIRALANGPRQAGRPRRRRPVRAGRTWSILEMAESLGPCAARCRTCCQNARRRGDCSRPSTRSPFSAGDGRARSTRASDWSLSRRDSAGSPCCRSMTTPVWPPRMQHDQSGILTSPGAASKALDRLRDPSLRAGLGAAGRMSAERHWERVDMAEALVDELADTARRPGAGRSHGPDLSVVCPILDEAHALDDLVRPLSRSCMPMTNSSWSTAARLIGTRERLRAMGAGGAERPRRSRNSGFGGTKSKRRSSGRTRTMPSRAPMPS